jgi:sialic acid synthase SpsE
LKTRIIAEIGYNHNGSIDRAKELIDEVSKLGLWAVKFQKWEIDNFPEHIREQSRNDEHAYGDNYYEHRKFLELSISEIVELRDYSEKKGLTFICSGKDLLSVRKLIQAGIKHVKVPSQRYKSNTIFKLLFANKKNGVYAFVSTGMMYGREVLKSRWLQCADVLFHCVSLYPAPLEKLHFEWMRRLFYIRHTHKKSCGYSSHESEGKGIPFAVAIGADYIERHFTLDKTDKGSDHKISSDVKEMKNIIKEIKRIEKYLGDGARPVCDKEWKLREYYRSF